MAHPERLLWTEAPVPGSIGAGQGQWKSTSLPFLFFFAALPFFPPTFSWLTPNACCGRKRLYLAPLGRGRDSGSPRAFLFSSSLLLFPFFPQLFHGSPRTLVVDGSACTWLHWGGAGAVEVHEPSFSLLLCCSSLFPPTFSWLTPNACCGRKRLYLAPLGRGRGSGSPRAFLFSSSLLFFPFPPNFFMAHPERLLWTEAPVPGSIGAGQGQWKSTSLPFLFFFAALPFFPPTFSWLTPNACCGRKRLYLAPLGRGRDSGSPRAFLFSSSLLLFPFFPQLFHGSPRTLVVDGSACTWLHWGGAGTVEVHEPSFSLLLCCSSLFSPYFFMAHPERLLWTEAPVPGSIGAGQGQWKSTSLPFLFFFAALPFFPPTFSWLTPNACCGRKRLYLAPLGRGRDSGSPRAFLFSSSLLLFPFFPPTFKDPQWFNKADFGAIPKVFIHRLNMVKFFMRMYFFQVTQGNRQMAGAIRFAERRRFFNHNFQISSMSLSCRSRHMPLSLRKTTERWPVGFGRL